MSKFITEEAKPNRIITRVKLSVALLSLAILCGCVTKPNNINTAEVVATKTPIAKNATPTSESKIRSLEGITISPELSAELNEDGISTVLKAVSKYREKYKCKNPLSFQLKDFSPLSVANPNGSTIVTLEQASPGIISLNPKDIYHNKARSIGLSDLYDTVLHASSHACKPLKPLELSTPLKLKDGNSVIGYSGFIVNVKDRNGVAMYYTNIEEAFAEALAIKINLDFTSIEPSYTNLASLALYIINKYSDPGTVSFQLQNNDLMGLVKTIRGVTPDTSDLKFVMTLFQKANDGKPIDLIKEELFLQRGTKLK